MAEERIEIEIVLDDKSIKRGFAKINKEGKGASKKLEKGFVGAFAAIKRSLAGIAAALAGLQFFKVVLRDFAEFEKGLVSVGKTTDILGGSLLILGDRLKGLSETIPVSTNNLLKLAQTAGQFGVKGSDNIIAFTETLAKLELATDIVGDEGAKSLARLLSVTKESTSTVASLGAVITDLGNNFAASEGEILKVGTEVAKITSIFGASSAQAVALGAALKQSGVQAEAGSTAVGKAFILINEAISEGGETLADFARISGKTNAQLKKDFGDNAVETFNDFIAGLSKIKQTGGDVVAELKNIGLGSDRVVKSLLPLINNYRVLDSALERANIQLRIGTALNIEVSRATDTLASDVTFLGAAFTNTSSAIGKLFSPAARAALGITTDLIKNFGDLAGTLSADTTGDISRLRFELGGINDEIEILNNKIKSGGISEGPGASAIKSFVDGIFGSPEERKAEFEARAKEIVAEIAQLQGTVAAGVAEIAAPTTELLGKVKEDSVILFDTLGNTIVGFTDLVTTAFVEFGEKTNQVFLFTAEQAIQLAKAFGQTFAVGITKSIQSVVSAVAKGQNAFEALGKSLLNLVADLAISIGQFVVALGVAKLAAEALPGGATIAAGLGLIAIGTILKAVAGSGFSGGAGAGESSGATGSADFASADISNDEELDKGTAVTVNVEGTVLDPIGVGQQIAEILDETFNAGASTVRVTSA